MVGITIEQAEAQLGAWLQASTDVAQRGQSYSISGRSLSRADLTEISRQITYWDNMVKKLSRSGSRRRGPRYVVGE